jgi:hypothetical protein
MRALKSREGFADLPARGARLSEMLEGRHDREVIRCQGALANVENAPPQLLGRFVTAKRLPHCRQARHDRPHLGMILPLAPLHLEKAQQEGLGRGKRRLPEVDARQVIEEQYQIRMIGPDRAVADFQRLAEVLFRLHIVPHFQLHRAVPYERRDVGM